MFLLRRVHKIAWRRAWSDSAEKRVGGFEFCPSFAVLCGCAGERRAKCVGYRRIGGLIAGPDTVTHILRHFDEGRAVRSTALERSRGTTIGSKFRIWSFWQKKKNQFASLTPHYNSFELAKLLQQKIDSLSHCIILKA